MGVNDVNSLLRALASLEHEISDGNDDHDDGHDDGPVLSHCFLHNCRARPAVKVGILYNVRFSAAELQTVLFLFLQELHRFHSILSQAAIELAAIDSECCGSSYLIAAELLEH